MIKISDNLILRNKKLLLFVPILAATALIAQVLLKIIIIPFIAALVTMIIEVAAAYCIFQYIIGTYVSLGQALRHSISKILSISLWCFIESFPRIFLLIFGSTSIKNETWFNLGSRLSTTVLDLAKLAGARFAIPEPLPIILASIIALIYTALSLTMIFVPVIISLESVGFLTQFKKSIKCFLQSFWIMLGVILPMALILGVGLALAIILFRYLFGLEDIVFICVSTLFSAGIWVYITVFKTAVYAHLQGISLKEFEN